MIFKLLVYVSLLPLNLAWLWAYSGFAKGLSDQKRLKRLRLLSPRNGPKQIILVQIANTLWRLGNDEEAILQFALARHSEQDWGKRRNSRVSEYIITYYEYCTYLVRFGTAMEPEDHQTKRF